MKQFLSATFMAIMLAVATQAGALTMYYDFKFSGSVLAPPYKNNANATGTIGIDSTKLSLTSPNYFDLTTPEGKAAVTHLTVTVNGAVAGNGTYTLSDFGMVSFDVSKIVTIDLAKQLVGQATSGSYPWGTPEWVPQADPPVGYGDFELFAVTGSTAPTGGWDLFTLGSNNGTGDLMQITNFILGVPEPSTFVLLGLGLGGLVFIRRENKRV